MENDERYNRDELNCKHGWIVENKCVTCGMPEFQCGGSPTIPLGYLNPKLKVSPSMMERIRDQNLKRLLRQKKLHLLLDLDNTLIHVLDISNLYNYQNNTSFYNQYHKILNGTKLVKLRPDVETFLQCAKNLFDLSIYTMASSAYAQEVANVLDPDGSLFGNKRIISRENCTRKDKKGLDVVISHHQVVLIVDDNVDIWAECDRFNVIPISPYLFFNHFGGYEFDGELARVWGVLSQVHSQFFQAGHYESRDVRQFLASTFQLSACVDEDMELDLSEYQHDMDVDIHFQNLRLDQ